MAKQLAGVTFIHNGIKQDYCWQQTVKCLLEFCDHVYLIEAGSDDGTQNEMDYTNPNLTVIHFTNENWKAQSGKEKLCYYTDFAIKRAEADGYEYVFSLQCDEILHEKSYSWIHKAIESGSEGFLVSRINLWASPYLKLDVGHHRKPCSTEVVRLTKSCYRTYGDAESIASPCNSSFVEHIRIYHMGFVRKREVHVEKIRHMQQEIFMTTPDEKLSGMTIFDPYQWFAKEDLKPIGEPLPTIIQEWASQRHYED